MQILLPWIEEPPILCFAEECLNPVLCFAGDTEEAPRRNGGREGRRRESIPWPEEVEMTRSGEARARERARWQGKGKREGRRAVVGR